MRNITTSITRQWLVCSDFNKVTNALEKMCVYVCMCVCVWGGGLLTIVNFVLS